MGDDEEPEFNRQSEPEPERELEDDIGNRLPESERRQPRPPREDEGNAGRVHHPHGSQFIGVRLNVKARMRLNELSTKWSCSRSEVIRRLLLTAPDESPCEPTSPASPTVPSPIIPPPPGTKP